MQPKQTGSRCKHGSVLPGVESAVDAPAWNVTSATLDRHPPHQQTGCMERKEYFMGIVLYALIGVIVILWLLGLTGAVAAFASLSWLLLVVAVALLLAAVLTGGRL